MSLEKAIKYGKEKRKPYKGAKAVDYSCRNNGDCDYCRDNRLYSDRKAREDVGCKHLNRVEKLNCVICADCRVVL